MSVSEYQRQLERRCLALDDALTMRDKQCVDLLARLAEAERALWLYSGGTSEYFERHTDAQPLQALDKMGEAIAQLECLRTNLNKGMSKSIQKMQATAIAETLASIKARPADSAPAALAVGDELTPVLADKSSLMASLGAHSGGKNA